MQLPPSGRSMTVIKDYITEEFSYIVFAVMPKLPGFKTTVYQSAVGEFPPRVSG